MVNLFIQCAARAKPPPCHYPRQEIEIKEAIEYVCMSISMSMSMSVSMSMSTCKCVCVCRNKKLEDIFYVLKLTIDKRKYNEIRI